MEVYGDPEFCCRLPVLIARARNRIETASPESVEQLREAVIQLGQLEQAVEDWAEASSDRNAFRRCLCSTADQVALAFFKAWRGAGIEPGHLRRALEWMDELGGVPDVEVRVKLPEGFAFYRLFPEQYCAAAIAWSSEREVASGRVAVIGIRSIGTALSAVVHSALRNRGWDSYRLTLRPVGHPFCRKAKLSELDPQTTFALVVDEGPGASGSSMVSVAEALLGGGLRRDQIFFFPGHQHGPGPAATPGVRRVWATIQQRTVRWCSVQWEGKPALEFLAGEALRLTKRDVAVVGVDDLSGGKWRRVAFRDRADWPAVCPVFERSKYLIRLSDGTSILAKFAGLGLGIDGGSTLAEEALHQCKVKADAGWVPRPCGIAHGFLIRPWIDGEPLSASAADSDLMRKIGSYLAQTMGQPLSDGECSCAVKRLERVLRTNGPAACPELGGELVDECLEPIRSLFGVPSAPDGRMSPHEWIRTADGLVKIDGLNHQLDHTIVGRQPVLWDLAGLAVEWNLDDSLLELACDELRRAGVPVERDVILFYEMAYASFRFGQMTFAIRSDDAEQDRVRRAAAMYRSRLRRCVGALSVA